MDKVQQHDHEWERTIALYEFRPCWKMAGDWCRLSTSAVSEEQLEEFREHEPTARVLGDDDFQQRLEKKLGRILKRQKPGPKTVPKP